MSSARGSNNYDGQPLVGPSQDRHGVEPCDVEENLRHTDPDAREPPMSVMMQQNQPKFFYFTGAGALSFVLIACIGAVGLWYFLYWNNRAQPLPGPPGPPPKPTGTALFLLGGNGGISKGLLSDVLRLDVTELDNPLASKSSWTPCAKMNLARQDPRAVILGQFIYLTGGVTVLEESKDKQMIPKFDRYSPIADSWTNLPSTMIHSRTEHCAVAIPASEEVPDSAASIYVIGGMIDNWWHPSNSTEKFVFDSNSSQGWIETAHAPIPLVGHECVAHNAYIFVFGGGGDWLTGVKAPEGFRYDPALDKWYTLHLACRLWRHHYGLVSLPLGTETRLYAISGNPDPTSMNHTGLCSYNCCSPGWEASPSDAQPNLHRWRFAAAAISSRGTIIIAGGDVANGTRSQVTDSMEEFKPNNSSMLGRWSILSVTLPRTMNRFALIAFTFT